MGILIQTKYRQCDTDTVAKCDVIVDFIRISDEEDSGQSEKEWMNKLRDDRNGRLFISILFLR